MSEMDVATLKIALDDSAREAVQTAINAIAEGGDTSTDAGLVAMLRQAISVVRQHEGAWTHAAAQNEEPMPADEAEAKFGQATVDARSRFETEVIRNVDGQTTRTDAPPLPDTDAPGRVVVTFIVAAERELKNADAQTRAALDAVLDDLVAVTPEDFVALEVIWSPADANDRMSLEKMREVYPELFELGS